ncbi:hypothetical protein AAG570_007561 [Ranatra chinensis]|uniref:Uncharacterized protein n=1 Tax=Ranatra chinensis TaxID=642074 RepID=A0ABD0XW90_9HEMI
MTMPAIFNMPESTGDPERLTDFLEAASTHLRSVNALVLPEVVNNIYCILIRKISQQVRAECGIMGSTEAAKVARLLTAIWRSPETASEVCGQAIENEESARGDTQPGWRLLREAVLSEMPEKTRRQLKALSNGNFGVLLAQVDEEEDDYQAAREGGLTGVTRDAPHQTLHTRYGGSSRSAIDWRGTSAEKGPTRDRASSSTGAYRGERREGPQERSPRGKLLVRVGRLDTELQQYSSDEDWPALPQRTQRQGRKGYQCVPTRPRFGGPAKGLPCIVFEWTVWEKPHVMDWSSNDYKAILQTDALKSVKGWAEKGQLSKSTKAIRELCQQPMKGSCEILRCTTGDRDVIADWQCVRRRMAATRFLG